MKATYSLSVSCATGRMQKQSWKNWTSGESNRVSSLSRFVTVGGGFDGWVRWHGRTKHKKLGWRQSFSLTRKMTNKTTTKLGKTSQKSYNFTNLRRCRTSLKTLKIWSSYWQRKTRQMGDLNYQVIDGSKNRIERDYAMATTRLSITGRSAFFSISSVWWTHNRSRMNHLRFFFETPAVSKKSRIRKIQHSLTHLYSFVLPSIHYCSICDDGMVIMCVLLNTIPLIGMPVNRIIRLLE